MWLDHINSLLKKRRSPNHKLNANDGNSLVNNIEWKAITFLCGCLSLFGVVSSLRVAVTSLCCVVYSLRVVVISLCFVVSSLCLVM